METEEWRQFYKTGKIKDYLIYRESVSDCTDAGKKGEEAVKHAGFCDSDRDDFTGASHGGI